MHRARNNGVMTLERAVELILANDHHEFLSYFPDMKNYFDTIEALIKGVYTICHTWDAVDFQAKWEEHFSERVAKKQFALNFANQMTGGLKPLAFKCYEKRGEEWLNSLTPAQWVKIFEHQFRFVGGIKQ